MFISFLSFVIHFFVFALRFHCWLHFFRIAHKQFFPICFRLLFESNFRVFGIICFPSIPTCPPLWRVDLFVAARNGWPRESHSTRTGPSAARLWARAFDFDWSSDWTFLTVDRQCQSVGLANAQIQFRTVFSGLSTCAVQICKYAEITFAYAVNVAALVAPVFAAGHCNCPTGSCQSGHRWCWPDATVTAETGRTFVNHVLSSGIRRCRSTCWRHTGGGGGWWENLERWGEWQWRGNRKRHL